MNGNFKHTALIKAALLGMTLLASTAWALPSDRNQPISLVADRGSFNEKSGVMTYSGNVVIEQGTMKLQAASIVVNLNAKKEISSITASGSPARFQQQLEANKGLAKGQANKITYNAQTGILTLSGNAILEQNGASLKGSTLRYSMNKGDIEAIGTPGSSSGRVQIVIPPSSTKSFPGARD
ncbi:lipopolysaccharide transport periplasmic protein LptA [uncultured Acinetobacter sp.]|uniref:lipopolysaccharide transport periplasmic protein LptA n=1 Tax=uncultured Acinetobacter sp. TaxID=165433 RepID=UPI002637D3A2|nr:lipopolysaccharide transport periplasmic protein LptA [uncultured Acinetobacter sp.]